MESHLIFISTDCLPSYVQYTTLPATFYWTYKTQFYQPLSTEHQPPTNTHSQLYIISFFFFYIIEYKLQVLANLANFGYDPVNYEFFRKLNILDLFLDVLVVEEDVNMIEFAIGGICNCCLDKLNHDFFIRNGAVSIITQHLSSSHEETVISAITTLIFLSCSQTTSGNFIYILILFTYSRECVSTFLESIGSRSFISTN